MNEDNDVLDSLKPDDAGEQKLATCEINGRTILEYVYKLNDDVLDHKLFQIIPYFSAQNKYEQVIRIPQNIKKVFRDLFYSKIKVIECEPETFIELYTFLNMINLDDYYEAHINRYLFENQKNRELLERTAHLHKRTDLLSNMPQIIYGIEIDKSNAVTYSNPANDPFIIEYALYIRVDNQINLYPRHDTKECSKILEDIKNAYAVHKSNGIMYMEIIMYIENLIGEKSEEEIKKMLVSAIEKKCIGSMYMHLDRYNDTPEDKFYNFKNMEYCWEQKRKPRALLELGRLYYVGNGRYKDESKGMCYLREYEENMMQVENKRLIKIAQINLIIIYNTLLKHTKQSERKKLLEKKYFVLLRNVYESDVNAEFSYHFHIHQLGMCYLNGSGTEKSTSEGIKLLEESWAKNKYLNSAKLLITCYRDGIVTEKNTQRADELEAEIKNYMQEIKKK